MSEEPNQRKKTFRSIAEVEKALFPKSYAQQNREKKTDDPLGYGSQVAQELMEAIRKEIAKPKGK